MKHIFFILAILCAINSVHSQTIINSYAAVLSFNSCNQLTVDNAAGFAPGDDVLIIQMKGAHIDTTNTGNFGSINNLNNCGNYEINRIQSVTANNINFSFNLLRSYDIPSGKVQLVRIPRHTNYTITSPHTATSWNGTKGGVFAIIVTGTLTMNDDINVSNTGFRGAVNANPTNHTQFTLNQTDFCFPVNNFSGAMKGEGIAEISTQRLYCRGELFNGGGGGNSTNAGGGGGSNGGLGGRGGDEWVGATPQPVGGRGGRMFNYAPTINKITIGGGGGAGDVNNAYTSNGGNGGGLIMILANTIVGNNRNLSANGQQGLDCSVGCIDGFGGGGGGGTVLINAQSISQLNVNVKGGRGANVTTNAGHGPGGGGSGGAVLVNNPTLFSNITIDNTGGAAGILNVNGSLSNWGAQAGSAGDTTSGFIIPVASVPFNQGSFLTSISDTLSSCQTLTLRAYANTGIATINWNFGDGNAGTGNPATHAYTQPGTYTVTAFATSSNGCVDTLTKNVIVPAEQMNVIITDTIYNCRSVRLTALTNGGSISNYSWQLGDGNSGTGSTITHTYTQPGNYSITLITTDAVGCTDTFSHAINSESSFNYTIQDSIIDCIRVWVDTLRNGGQTASTIRWLFGDGNASNTSPVLHKYQNTGTFKISLILSDTFGCTDTVIKTIYPEDKTITVDAGTDTTICFNSIITITATGASTYEWFPKNGLDNDKAATITTRQVEPVIYTVVGKDTNNCLGYDTVKIGILPLPVITIAATSNEVTCNEPQVTLTAFGASRYVWGPSEYFTDSTKSNQTVSPKVNTKYYVYGYDDLGCWDVITKTILVNKDASIFIADAFTPNNDGLNDKIRPYEICNFVFDEFRVFNRWGELLYTSADITRGWDGIYKNTSQKLGTYYYMITGKTHAGNHVVFKGNFTLIR